MAYAIRSALSQSYANIEVIVVNDGSTDRSWEIVKSFGSKIRSFSIPHQGAPVARNHGLEQAQGDYIQFLDADDLLKHDKIEKCIAAFEPGIDAVYCGLEHFSQDERSDQTETRLYALLRVVTTNPFSHVRTKPQIKKDESGMTYFLERVIQTSQPLHRRRSLVKVGGFRPALAAGQDYDLHIRLMASGAVFKEIEEKLVLIRSHDGRDRISNHSDSVLHAVNTFEMIRSTVLDSDFQSKRTRRALAKRYFRYAIATHARDHLSLSNNLYKKAKNYCKYPISRNLIFNLLILVFGFHRACRIRLQIISILN